MDHYALVAALDELPPEQQLYELKREFASVNRELERQAADVRRTGIILFGACMLAAFAVVLNEHPTGWQWAIVPEAVVIGGWVLLVFAYAMTAPIRWWVNETRPVTKTMERSLTLSLQSRGWNVS
jgi:hypothetical protein